jgi:hypothetical protein
MISQGKEGVGSYVALSVEGCPLVGKAFSWPASFPGVGD